MAASKPWTKLPPLLKHLRGPFLSQKTRVALDEDPESVVASLVDAIGAEKARNLVHAVRDSFIFAFGPSSRFSGHSGAALRNFLGFSYTTTEQPVDTVTGIRDIRYAHMALLTIVVLDNLLYAYSTEQINDVEDRESTRPATSVHLRQLFSSIGSLPQIVGKVHQQNETVVAYNQQRTAERAPEAAPLDKKNALAAIKALSAYTSPGKKRELNVLMAVLVLAYYFEGRWDVTQVDHMRDTVVRLYARHGVELTTDEVAQVLPKTDIRITGALSTAVMLDATTLARDDLSLKHPEITSGITTYSHWRATGNSFRQRPSLPADLHNEMWRIMSNCAAGTSLLSDVVPAMLESQSFKDILAKQDQVPQCFHFDFPQPNPVEVPGLLILEDFNPSALHTSGGPSPEGAQSPPKEPTVNQPSGGNEPEQIGPQITFDHPARSSDGDRSEQISFHAGSVIRLQTERDEDLEFVQAAEALPTIKQVRWRPASAKPLFHVLPGEEPFWVDGDPTPKLPEVNLKLSPVLAEDPLVIRTVVPAYKDGTWTSQPFSFDWITLSSTQHTNAALVRDAFAAQSHPTVLALDKCSRCPNSIQPSDTVSAILLTTESQYRDLSNRVQRSLAAHRVLLFYRATDLNQPSYGIATFSRLGALDSAITIHDPADTTAYDSRFLGKLSDLLSPEEKKQFAPDRVLPDATPRLWSAIHPFSHVLSFAVPAGWNNYATHETALLRWSVATDLSKRPWNWVSSFTAHSSSGWERAQSSVAMECLSGDRIVVIARPKQGADAGWNPLSRYAHDSLSDTDRMSEIYEHVLLTPGSILVLPPLTKFMFISLAPSTGTISLFHNADSIDRSIVGAIHASLNEKLHNPAIARGILAVLSLQVSNLMHNFDGLLDTPNILNVEDLHRICFQVAFAALSPVVLCDLKRLRIGEPPFGLAPIISQATEDAVERAWESCACVIDLLDKRYRVVWTGPEEQRRMNSFKWILHECIVHMAVAIYRYHASLRGESVQSRSAEELSSAESASTAPNPTESLLTRTLITRILTAFESCTSTTQDTQYWDKFPSATANEFNRRVEDLTHLAPYFLPWSCDSLPFRAETRECDPTALVTAEQSVAQWEAEWQEQVDEFEGHTLLTRQHHRLTATSGEAWEAEMELAAQVFPHDAEFYAPDSTVVVYSTQKHKSRAHSVDSESSFPVRPASPGSFPMSIPPVLRAVRPISRRRKRRTA
ncbi:hypothetical protein C8F01DRAFT_3186 [Mycena amicta]|nr:hypothetical protein C8F01DRAFT_3186 [Mycena amicta]